MNEDLNSKKEFAENYYLYEFIGEMLRLLSLHFQGKTTLNHLRIGNYIGLLSLSDSAAISNKMIAQALNIPPSTVSRVVDDFVREKWVLERHHPDDGRIRLLSINPDHVQAGGFEKNVRVILKDLLQHHDAGEFSPDPLSGKSFKSGTSKEKPR